MELISMAIPIYLLLCNDEGKQIKGGSDVRGREGSIEVVGMQHDLFIPADNMSGALTGTRQHEAFTFEKEITPLNPTSLPSLNYRSDPGKSRIQTLPHQ